MDPGVELSEEGAEEEVDGEVVGGGEDGSAAGVSEGEHVGGGEGAEGGEKVVVRDVVLGGV